MMLARLMFIFLLASLTACGAGSPTCDDGPYKSAELAPRLQVPEDLDNLDQFREMPLPVASPQAPQPEDSSCLEKPPRVIGIS